MKKPLIMAKGSGYTEKDLSPFFKSLNQSVYTGDICFFTQKQDAKAVSNFSKALGYTEAHGVRLDGNVADSH